MRSLLLIVCLWACHSASAQEFPYEKDDTLFYSPTIKFWEGQKLKLGKGSGVNGTFAFINENRTSFASLMTRSTDQMAALVPMPKDFNGLSVDVKKWKKVGNKRMGFKYQLILKGDITYECDPQSAIDAKEIIVSEPSK
jgi:hypothetical protein